jgi:hypothetical protein
MDGVALAQSVGLLTSSIPLSTSAIHRTDMMDNGLTALDGWASGDIHSFNTQSILQGPSPLPTNNNNNNRNI